MEMVKEEFPIGNSNPTELGTLGEPNWACANQGEITANKAIKIDLITCYSIATYNKMLNIHIKCNICPFCEEIGYKMKFLQVLSTLTKVKTS
jgi:hypothetical protein